MLASDTFPTFATHASLGDLSPIDCWDQNGALTVVFCDFQRSIFSTQNKKSSGKLLCENIYSIPNVRALDVCLVGFPFKLV